MASNWENIMYKNAEILFAFWKYKSFQMIHEITLQIWRTNFYKISIVYHSNSSISGFDIIIDYYISTCLCLFTNAIDGYITAYLNAAKSSQQKFWFYYSTRLNFSQKIHLNFLQYSMFTRSDYRFLFGSAIQLLH